MKVNVVLITGRTIKQGIGLGRGKDSDLYRQETGTIDLHGSVLERLGVKEGAPVLVQTPFGAAVFSCRRGDVPANVAFIPYGKAANRLIGAAAEGCGMPCYKGIPAVVGRYGDG